MLPEKLLNVLNHEGVVSIVTMGETEPHVVNTWNSYVNIFQEQYILFPAGNMKTTENNIEKNNKVQITLGSREVQGFNGPGTGFLTLGTASFVKSGEEFDIIKGKFPWARAAVKVKVESATQTL